MDKKKAREFLKELEKLQEKYGLQISSNYEQEIDYDYEESPYVSGVNSYITIVDKDGFEISIEDLERGYSTCFYCGRNIEGDHSFCNSGCEEKYSARQNVE